MQPTERDEVRVFVVCETRAADGSGGRVPHSVMELCPGTAPREDQHAGTTYDEDVSPGSDFVIIAIDITGEDL
jgi:orotidine-5'-phosphate decarboxylase